jgi:hypothetical protein
VDYWIEKVAKPLPEGNYEVTARGGEIIRLRFQDGHWLAAS